LRDEREGADGEVPRRTSVRTIVAGIVLGSVALWLAFRGLDLEELWRALARVDPAWTLAAFVSNAVSLVAVTWRWQLLFYPDHRTRRFWPLFCAVVIGQMVNIVVPLRLGEVARMYLVAEEERLSKARVLATLAVEKALDLGVFALAVVLVLALFAFPGGVGIKRGTLWGVGVGGSLALWLLSRFSDRLTPWVHRLSRYVPGRFGGRATGIAERFLEGLSALKSPGVSVAAVAWSVAIMGLAALTNYLMFLACGFNLSFLVAVFLLVLIQVGSVPPSLPGKIGIFHFLVVVGLGMFGIDRGAALGYAIVLYAVALLSKVVLGAAFAATGRRGRLAPRPASTGD
jgi:glycosyltransferase 2 family protein